MKIKSVGILGYGHFGKFLHEMCERFFPEIEIRIYSRHKGEDGGVFVSEEVACQSDVVIMCAAIRDYEAQIKQTVALTPSTSIIVDVATVKKHTTELLRKHAGDRKFISTHPMFGPESYKKHHGDVSGFRIVVTDYALTNDEAVQLKNVFARLGFLIVEMTADEHDERLANTLFLTHYLAQSISGAGFGRTNIDTLSFQFLMDGVESVIEDKELFQDVYQYNPYCQAAVEKLHDSLDNVYEELKSLNAS